MDQFLYHVDDLPAATRLAVESLIGQPLHEHGALYILPVPKEGTPPQGDRRQAWNELQAMMAEMQQSAAESGLSGDEIDRIIDETCEEVRYGHKA